MSTSRSFLSLPPDLRQRIYTHLLVSPVPIKGPIARRRQDETYDIHTAILRINKQISNEAKHIFFGFNTFSVSSVPLPRTEDEVSGTREGSGAFEPPLQLKDLDFVRSLEVDLVYAATGGAERYITSLSFLLAHTKGSLAQLTLTGDVRPHISPDGSLDHRKFLSGFCAATSSTRFQAALTVLPVQTINVTFEFEDIRFDFNVLKGVLMSEEWGLSWLAGQVLLKRVELGLGGIMAETVGFDGEEVLEGEGSERWW